MILQRQDLMMHLTGRHLALIEKNLIINQL